MPISYDKLWKLLIDKKMNRTDLKGASGIIAVENEVADNMYQRSELDYLIYNAPVAYAELILSGDPEEYLKAVTEYKPFES